MVKLTDNYLEAPEIFEQAQIKYPTYDQNDIIKLTQEKPQWVHFGGGNLFRCFHAKIAHDLINQGELKTGVIVAETYDENVINEAYIPFSNRMLQVVMDEKGGYQKTLLASVAQSLYYNQQNPSGWQALRHIFEQSSLQLVTMSITEKGYQLTDINGELTAAAKADITHDPEVAQTNMGAIARLLLARFKAGRYPIAMVSTDNFSENGQKFQEGILTIAKGWVKQQLAPTEFLNYLTDPDQVSFPWSMIDRITPNPSEQVAKVLHDSGFEDTTIIHTPKHTNIAPFGNTEVTYYLVIEDQFPNGRPPLENAGVILTDRQTVNDVDQMKVTACLNPLHTALAIFGSLLGYQSIADEMTNPDLVNLIKRLGYQEALPVVKNPGIIQPKAFIDEVIERRLPNKNIPDTPQRIASDTSQKIPVRYGVTIKHYLDNKRSLDSLRAIPLVFAGWCRYLMAIDDQGEAFIPSLDPLYEQLHEYVKSIKLGQSTSVHTYLQPILTNQQIFGFDLYEIQLGKKVEHYFEQMIQGPGAIMRTIQTVMEDN